MGGTRKHAGRSRRPVVVVVLGMVAALVGSIAGVPPAAAAPGDINTFAGGGVGDGGQATAAKTFTPLGIDTDAAGNVYFADQGAHRVRRVDAVTGIITTVAGTGAPGFSGDGGPATEAQLASPADVAFDTDGHLYIADLSNVRIRKVTPGGIITTVAGSGDFPETGHDGDGGPALEGRFIPYHVAVFGSATSGAIYISDNTNNTVRKVDLATGIITTFAGTGEYGFSGDGGPAENARFIGVQGIATDAAGDLYIADQFSNRIRKVSGGIITTVAGSSPCGPDDFFCEGGFSGDGGQATAAELLFPNAVEISPSGEMFIVDQGNQRIRKVDAGGVIQTVVGDGGNLCEGIGGLPLESDLAQPNDVAVDGTGNLYITDPGFQCPRVLKVPPGGPVTPFAGGGVGDGAQASEAFMEAPWGITTFGAITYVSEQESNRVRRIDASGIITTVAGTGTAGFSGDDGPGSQAQLSGPRGVAVDAAGNLYIADCGNHRIRRVDAATGVITTVAGNGTAGNTGDGGQATAASLSCPSGVFVVTSGDPAPGTIFIADAGAHVVRKVDPSGVITTVAGTGTAGYNGDGIPATTAQLNTPLDVVVDAAGNLLIADQRNNRVRSVSPSGIITTVAGTGAIGYGADNVPATTSKLTEPSGLTLDAAGNLYIAEGGFSRVRKVDASGIITTVAGNGIPGFSGDGGPATIAHLDVPVDVAIDASGNLLITDRINDRVRLVEPGSPPPSPSAGCGAVVTSNIKLKVDIGPCPGDGLIIGADNVKINLNGHTIFGNAGRTGLYAGITLTGRSGVEIRNGTVRNFDAGVAIIGGSGNLIENMVIRDNLGSPSTSSQYGDGIGIFFSSDNRILRNTLTNNGIFDGIGVLGVGADRNLIQLNTVDDTTADSLFGPTGIGILVNPFLGFDLPREVSVTGNHIVANTVRNNAQGGISNLSNVDGVISSNIVTGNGLGSPFGVFPGNGIGVQNLLFATPETRVLVKNNQVHGNGRNGIEVLSRRNKILNNDASDNAVNGSPAGDHDLSDTNPNCDANIWRGNIWGSGGYSPPCTTFEGSGPPAPLAAATADGGAQRTAASAGDGGAGVEPMPRGHPPRPPS